jgi:predicted transposase/invertase (TIGR01784 family)
MEDKSNEKVNTEALKLLAEYPMNLSDFALFLSVMKIKKAYQCTLSLILDEPNIQLKEVKVEQVILNKSGKRAIRLDAWAISTDNRQFNMEMQNNSTDDNLPKRSRFYQGMLDTPILKSGKKTKYKKLPSTVIIFITQDDIFGKDLAKYTFTEQCEEVSGLHLEDGTKKIF